MSENTEGRNNRLRQSEDYKKTKEIFEYWQLKKMGLCG